MGVVIIVASKEENPYNPLNLPKPERISPTMAQYKNFRDMFDGGGAGKSGPKFEGGGVISDLGNLLFDPLGSRNANYQNTMTPLSNPQMVAQDQVPVQRVEETRKTQSSNRLDSSPIPKPNPYSSLFDLRLLESIRQNAANERAVYGLDTILQRNAMDKPPVVDSTPPKQPTPPKTERFIPVYPTASLSFEDFLSGLGDVRFQESPEALLQAYQLHMQGYK